MIILKTWFITGASSGIGLGIAKAVLKRGDNAVVTARNISKFDQLKKEYPKNLFPVSLELSDKNSIYVAVQTVLEQFDSVDVLINNAGHGYLSGVEEGDPEGVDRLFKTNFFGAVELIKQILPQMRKQKSGAIVNVSSIAAARSAVGSGYYAASKAALELMSDGLRQEVGPLGIKTMIVVPGSFRTRFYDDSLKGTSIKIDDYAETSGTRRIENASNPGNQPGDPDKAGKVIVETVLREDSPFRLLIGSDAVRVVTDNLNERLKEVEAWADISASTDFE